MTKEGSQMKTEIVEKCSAAEYIDGIIEWSGMNSLRELARRLDVSHATIISWKNKNRIPKWRSKQIYDLLDEMYEARE
jgi:DNA invertase Pin-like site-specific DNA recombinase